MFVRGTTAQPNAEAVHHVGHVTRESGREDEVPFQITDPVLAGAELAGSKHRVDVVYHPFVDVADHTLIDPLLRIGRDLIDERESGTCGKDLERVLASRRGELLEDLLDLEVAQAVPLDPRGSMDRADPRAVPEPLSVSGVETEIGKEPPQVL